MKIIKITREIPQIPKDPYRIPYLAAYGKTFVFLCIIICAMVGTKIFMRPNEPLFGENDMRSVAAMSSAALTGSVNNNIDDLNGNYDILPPIVTSGGANVCEQASEENPSQLIGYPCGILFEESSWYTPLDGAITSLFDMRTDPFGGDSEEFHSGIDISAEFCDEVHAAEDGYVERVITTPSYGLSILITHRKNIQTLYAHLSESLVKKGDKVTAGDIIACAGSSGRSTAPHLHFEVRTDGTAVDPVNFIAQHGAMYA